MNNTHGHIKTVRVNKRIFNKVTVWLGKIEQISLFRYQDNLCGLDIVPDSTKPSVKNAVNNEN